MTDDRIDALFGALERPATPEPAFQDRLFDDLLVEAGFRPARAQGWPSSLRGLAGRGPSATARPIAAVGILVLLVALAVNFASVGTLAPGGTPSSTPSPTASPSPVVTSSPRASILVARPGSTVLRTGEQPPAWTSPDGSFSTADLGGRPAAIYIWCACTWGPQPETFFAEAAKRASTMDLVFVSIDSNGTTRGLVDWLDVRTPVVRDPEGTIVRTWGLDTFPALVFLRAGGTFADVHPSTFSPETLSASLDALASGDPTPDPDGAAGPPLDERGNLLLTSVLQVGQPAPELRGPRLSGGEASTSDFLGRRTAVASWLPPHLDGTPQDDVSEAAALLAAAKRHEDELNVVLVAAGEPEAGAAAAYLRAHGSNVPVIFDWDGALKQRWGLVMATTIVLLDADGRVAGYYGPEGVIAPDRLLDAFIAGDPVPTPGVVAH